MIPTLSPNLEPERFLEATFLRQVQDFLSVTTTATLDFPNTAASANADLTVSMLDRHGKSRGVRSGDTVTVTPPSTIEAGLTWCGFVSANDTVTVRIHVSGVGAVNPASAVWRVTVLKY